MTTIEVCRESFDSSCVYRAMNGQQTLYVGLGKTLARPFLRTKELNRAEAFSQCDRMIIELCSNFEEARVMEEALIHTLHPVFNAHCVLCKDDCNCPRCKRGKTRAITRHTRTIQEQQWYEDGWYAFVTGIKIKEFPRDQKPYSSAWYRCKSSWRAGWEDAKYGDAPRRLISPIAK